MKSKQREKNSHMSTELKKKKSLCFRFLKLIFIALTFDYSYSSKILKITFWDGLHRPSQGRGSGPRYCPDLAQCPPLVKCSSVYNPF